AGRGINANKGCANGKADRGTNEQLGERRSALNQRACQPGGSADNRPKRQMFEKLSPQISGRYRTGAPGDMIKNREGDKKASGRITQGHTDWSEGQADEKRQKR